MKDFRNRHLRNFQFFIILSPTFAIVVLGCNGSHRDSMPRPVVRPVNFGVRPSAAVTNPIMGDSQEGRSGRIPASWIPPWSAEAKRQWRGIIVHHSATRTGNAAELDKMHKYRRDRNGKRWLGLGYNFVINNGRGGPDGQVEVGFRWRDQIQGAHCRPKNNTNNYWNEHTIGICLVGNFEKARPSSAQYDSLAKLVSFLQGRYNIPMSEIRGHGEIMPTACPGRQFSWRELRRRLKEEYLATR